jgi:Prefoldin, molecular chaperone implicated in de novo protein folding, alpha subunit
MFYVKLVFHHLRVLKIIRRIADFQFSDGAGEILFPNETKIVFSTTGKPRQMLLNDRRVATLRPKDGFLTLGISGAESLRKNFPYPRFRVCVMSDVSEFIAQGRSVFAKHVVEVDERIRAGDEVIVVNKEDEILGTGKAILSGNEMLLFERGIAVKIRHGNEASED